MYRQARLALLVGGLAILGFVANAAGQESNPDSPRPTNALASESSPYLLMHAHNPVNWHAWNEETLALAKRLDKPIFLSIGYSSCHWCHVMERESFLDPEIAAFLNQHFVCIKVDREERPDVDEIYMHALLAITQGGGGWPLSMFLTPDAKPFYGGTYWPARDGDRGPRPGFLTVIGKIEKHFREDRELIERDADKVTEVTRELLAAREPVDGPPIQRFWINDTLTELSRGFDEAWGGFRFNPTNPNQPKFPEPSNLLFLIDQLRNPLPDRAAAPDADRIRNMLIFTCEKMMLGGMYDHLGGGFHRYSVDRYWRIPHFEKMLYDNAQLATVYAEAHALTGRADFRHVAEGTLDFVLRELTAPEGGFYSSLDAESDGEEGKFYRWTRAELKAGLSDSEYALFAPLYQIEEAPNFEQQYYAPQLDQPLATAAQAQGQTEAELRAALEPIREKLFSLRAERVRPLLDQKILTAWNGMMIRGFADAGRIFDRPDYLQAATRAAEFALRELVDEQGHLYRTSTAGEAKLNGYLVDYAGLIDGLLALHRATGDARWLNESQRLQEIQIQRYADDRHGGFFYTSADHEVLIARSKPMSDGAVPSGNSVSAANLQYLGEQLNRDDFRNLATGTIRSASPVLTRSGLRLPRMLTVANRILNQKQEAGD